MKARKFYAVLIATGIIAISIGGIYENIYRQPYHKEQETDVVVSTDQEPKISNSYTEDWDEQKEVEIEEQIKQKTEPVVESIQPVPKVIDAVNESILEGKIICIDAGHQSKGNNKQEPISPGSSETKAKVSSGTRGIATGKAEYELNLEVALKLKDALLAKKVMVYMVREKNDVDISNIERAQLANKVKADLSLRIHADGVENSSISGFSILVPGGNNIEQNIVSKSNHIAECVENCLMDELPNKSRGIISRNDLTGFNWCEVPAILVEMGFMSNPDEDMLMSTEEFQNALVKALIEGLEAYYSETE